MSLDKSHLGKTVSYDNPYDPSLLFPMSRQPKRDEIGAPKVLPFHGIDIWNVYELSWLNDQGKPIVAIGEIGLDYFRNLQPKEVQEKAFRKQLLLAKELGLAVVVHVRDAWDDALKILEETGNAKVVLHCFTGQMDHAKICIERGYYLSFSGVLTYPKNEYLREVARVATTEQILIETDCPYLPPQIMRGKRNEPAFVVETARCLADARGVSLEEIGSITTQNAVKVFGV